MSSLTRISQCGRGSTEAQVRLFSAHSEAFWIRQMDKNDGTSEFGGVDCIDFVEIYASVFIGSNGM